MVVEVVSKPVSLKSGAGGGLLPARTEPTVPTMAPLVVRVAAVVEERGAAGRERAGAARVG